MTYSSIFSQRFTRPVFQPSKHLPDLKGKVSIITGASTGLGKITALELARKGSHVFCMGRNVEKTKATIEEIKKDTGNENIEFLLADFMDLKTVEKAANSFLSRNLPLHILVNNAGIMACPFALSEDGIEAQFATNHFAHVVLTNKLLPLLIKSQPSRIVNVSSITHLWTKKSGINFDVLNDREQYNPAIRYSETKLANIYFTRKIQDRIESLGANHVYVNAVHPGVVKTELERNMQFKREGIISKMVEYIKIDPYFGALTQIYVAGSQEIEEKNIKGKYFVPYCKEKLVSATAQNEEYADKLWNWTEEILKEKFRKDWSWNE